MAGPSGSLLDGKAFEPVSTGMQGKVTVKESENSSYKDGLYAEEWIAKELGFENAILPDHLFPDYSPFWQIVH